MSLLGRELLRLVFFLKEFSTFAESLESMLFGDEVGNESKSIEHIQGLGLDDCHQNGDASLLQVLDSCLHGVESALVHEVHSAHADDDRLYMIRNVVHYFLETCDRPEEDGTIKALDIYLVERFNRDTMFVVPRRLLVKSSQFM